MEPEGHFSHRWAPGFEIRPKGHRLHCSERIELAYLPAGHCRQDVALWDLLAVPLGQGVHLSEPILLENVPDGQTTQVILRRE